MAVTHSTRCKRWCKTKGMGTAMGISWVVDAVGGKKSAPGLRRCTAPAKTPRAQTGPIAQGFGEQGVGGFVQAGGDVGVQGVGAFGRERHLGVGGVNTGQDVARTQRLQHRAQCVVQRQHVVRAAASGQGQHGFALERRLRQQVQKHLEHAAVSGLVDRRGHHQHARGGHLLNGLGDAAVAKIGQHQRLGREVADMDAINQCALRTQAQRNGIEQSRRARALRGASGNQQGRHGYTFA